jgi:ubiquitin-protein ligase
MNDYKTNLDARIDRIKKMMQLNGDFIKIDRQAENCFQIEALVPTIISNNGSLAYKEKIKFELLLPSGFPLNAKPEIYFRDILYRPVSPNIFKPGRACIGDWYESSTLVQLLRKILLEAVFDENTINLKSIANHDNAKIYESLLENPKIHFPLFPIAKINSWIPENPGVHYSDSQKSANDRKPSMRLHSSQDAQKGTNARVPEKKQKEI